MKIAFTGTRQGMSVNQRGWFCLLLGMYCDREGGNEFHHGDCVGADREAHDVVRSVSHLAAGGIKIVLHPPTINAARSFADGDESREPQEYLFRNRKMVDECDMLFATPLEDAEQLRSGTWSTIRYARKCGKKVIVIPRDDNVEFVT